MTPGGSEAIARAGVGVATTTAGPVGDGDAEYEGAKDRLAVGATVDVVRNADATASTATRANPISASGTPKFGRSRDDTRKPKPAAAASRDPGRTVS